MTTPSPWLRGPVEGVPFELQASAHALLDAGESLVEAARDLSLEELWATPGGAASVGFHLRHIAGSSERLITYSRGAELDEAAQQRLALEKTATPPLPDAGALLAEVLATIAHALATYRSVDPRTLSEPRYIGKARLQSSVLGALAHVADHMQRHTGQVITTARIVKGIGLAALTQMPPRPR